MSDRISPKAPEKAEERSQKTAAARISKKRTSKVLLAKKKMKA